MISNLSRIVLLILFKIYPELIVHDIIGILCLITYILIPFYFLCQWIYSNNQELSQKITEKTKAIFVSPVLGNPPDFDRLLAIAEKYNILFNNNTSIILSFLDRD